ncbi:hypothetical protein J4Q44_G00314290 [Coregonus suidteri]|uniref:TRM5/TYW2-like methyltransferase domain-containing protein n=1 Tax=Coregonus suidteri TaxID=861788 RepID=A0AAN8KP87_9TELE
MEENRYEFDVTRCMFSAGNITEKLRVASFNCSGETVVDLYAGIDYFTIPYLVHAGACCGSPAEKLGVKWSVTSLHRPPWRQPATPFV